MHSSLISICISAGIYWISILKSFVQFLSQELMFTLVLSVGSTFKVCAILFNISYLYFVAGLQSGGGGHQNCCGWSQDDRGFNVWMPEHSVIMDKGSKMAWKGWKSLSHCMPWNLKMFHLTGRGTNTHAYTHSVQMSHHVYINLHTLKFYCLPDNYEIIDSSLDDIKVKVWIVLQVFCFSFFSIWVLFIWSLTFT